tara:strand:- start:137 stop:601 length:465 start_codon:yes stop_codon:yes gene_type:complete
MKEKNIPQLSYSNILKKIMSEKLKLKPNNDKNLKLLIGKFGNFTNESLNGPEVASSIKWFLKSHKRVKVFTNIMKKFVKDEPIYKESIIKNLTEFSYKTITTIIDESITRGYLKNNFNYGKKIKLLQPSEQLIIDLLNWNILRFSKIDTGEIFK